MSITKTSLLKASMALIDLREGLEDMPAPIPDDVAESLDAIENYLLAQQKMANADRDVEFIADLLMQGKPG